VTKTDANSNIVTDTVGFNDSGGFAAAAMTAGQYGWFLTWGDVTCFHDTVRSASVGAPVIGAGAASVGKVLAMSSGVAATYQILGYVRAAQTAGASALTVRAEIE